MPQPSNTTSQPGGTQIKEELKQDAESLKETAGKRAETEARKGRDQAVGTAKATSQAFDSAAQELRDSEDAPEWLASMLTSVSGQIGDMANELDGKEPREMLQTAEQFGRDKPGMFLAASAAIGFAAGRYLRAGAEEYTDDHGSPMGSSQRTGRRSVTTPTYGAAAAATSTRPATTRATTPGTGPATTFAGSGAGDAATIKGGRS